MCATTFYEHDLVVLRNLVVPMRDGIRLSLDLYRPAVGGQPLEEPLPVLLERTPYGKGDQERAEQARFFARHGYLVAVQDCRGCFDSEGEFYFLKQEPFDGYDTVEWLGRQPWCNGKVGTYGTSYAAWTQSALATQAPPNLACMVLNMGGWNAHTNTVRHGGAFEMRFMAWAFWHSATNRNSQLKGHPWIDQVLNEASFRDWLTRMPIRKGHTPLSLVPNYEKWLFDIFTQGDYDEFWKQPGFAIEEYLEVHADVPTLISGGWYDSYPRASLDTFMALSRHKKGPVHVLMGPWTHGTYTTELSYAGDTDMGPEASLSSCGGFDRLNLLWFDRWLKDKPDVVSEEQPVTIMVMGGGSGRKNAEGRLDHGGRWRSESEWPLARTNYTHFYIHDDGTLSTQQPGEASSSTTYLFDPKDPVPTIGGNFSSLNYLKPLPTGVKPEFVPRSIRSELVTPNGGFDQQEGPQFFGCEPPYLPISSRPDVVVFQTPPLEQDTEITGPIEVVLWASSTAVDTDFTAKLIDVYPPNEDYPQGYALNLNDSIIRARYRDSRESAELMEPGQVYKFTITLYPTSNLFQRGHRIRLDISSSNFPRFDVNPNTGELLGLNRRTAVAENTIYHDRDYPSHVVLPVITG